MIDITQEEIMVNWGVDNSETPLVSIKCMTYNHKDFIAQALDSFLMQKTNFPFEVLVHDDASTDGTDNVIRGYEKKFPKIIKPIYETENQWSKGNGAHHVKIDAQTKGKYIAICEGDDYWIDESKLQKQVLFLEKNTQYSMSCHNAYKIDMKNNKSCLFNDEKFSIIGPRELILEWHIPTASILCKKDIYDKRLPVKKEYVQGDIQIYLASFDKGKIHYINKPMSVYRYNTSCSATEKSIANPFKYLNANILLWNDLNQFYNYKYNKWIVKKIRYDEYQIIKQKCIKKIPLLQILRKKIWKLRNGKKSK